MEDMLVKVVLTILSCFVGCVLAIWLAVSMLGHISPPVKYLPTVCPDPAHLKKVL